MYKLVTYIVRLLEHIAHEYPEIFAYIPQMYLETFVDSFHSLRRADPPYDLLHGTLALISVAVHSQSVIFVESHEASTQEIICFLLSHFLDARIINPGIIHPCTASPPLS